ncbi:MAG: LytTR family DNA-binding domain-containing protein [Phenylobacterium sp.]|uniref:LytTR family DNA-binding domain-containing protein n=1 Tax=Phenylobacterium sp. TaxID=1871053 RepID=UPI00391B784B
MRGPTVAETPADPLTGRVLLRALATSTVVGLFMSYVRAFGSGDAPFLARTAYMTVLAWIGALLGVASFRLVRRLSWTGGRVWLQAALSGAAMTPPMTLVVWGATRFLPGGGAPVRHLPGYAFNSLIMCLGMTALAVWVGRRRAVAADAPAAAPPRFLERLPPKLAGAELWAVEAEDHYLRLHTSKGQDLILMRLADAVAELDGIEGAQVHRSWWVSREAVVGAERGDGRAILTLKDGSKVPVSRTYAKAIRERGWI